MVFEKKVSIVQNSLLEKKLDGWLLYDFRCSNELAHKFLEIPKEVFVSRRFFYWIPAKGTPIKIVHSIESKTLKHLPGETKTYHSWKMLENILKNILKNKKTIAMEYSPRNAVPTVSKVDGGTIDLIREFGVEVVSSGDLLQENISVLTNEQIESHLKTCEILDQTVEKAWNLIKENQGLTEWDIQQFILNEFKKHNCITHQPPIVGVNAHSADPHYIPKEKSSSEIKRGDFILIDLWCKLNEPDAIYGDITRVGVADDKPSPKQLEIFNIVKAARDAGTELVFERFSKNIPLYGWEVDQCVRDVIVEAGYEKYFIHRTGHNIDQNDHGDGANIDNLETKEKRTILPGTCFSIEPGIYLPGDFGIRLEYDVLIHHDGKVQITGGIQNDLEVLLESNITT